MGKYKKYVYISFIFLLFSCSTKRNTLLTRKYHELTTRYNVYFNGNESFKAGEKRIEQTHKDNYNFLLPIYYSEDEAARSSSFSDMERASVKAMKAIKLHSIKSKPRRSYNNRSEKYIAFRKKKEYNDLIDDCYLLMGKANFYTKRYNKADKAFKFIFRQFFDKKIITEARIWYVRSLIEQNKRSQAIAQLSKLNSDKNLSEQNRLDLFKLNAYYNIELKDKVGAIDNLERLVGLVRGKEKSRYSFILAQLYAQVGQNSEAISLFGRVQKMNVSYEMSFNAQINKALAHASGNVFGIKKELKKMLRQSKNSDFRDQIYFALANIEMKSNNESKALDYYWKSVRSSLDNNSQKSMSFKVLGDFYYKKKDYKKAKICLDSCLFFNSSKIEGINVLIKMSNNLNDLVKNIDVVSRQDSLQSLARMSEKDRNEFIDNLIVSVKKKEEAKKEEKRQLNKDREFYLQRNAYSNTNVSRSSQSSGEWYFYNTMMVSSGKAEFTREWGRRKREDNWNRKDKSVVEQLDDIVQLEQEDVEVVSSLDLKSREHYLRDIPLTEESIIQSDSLVLEAMFAIAESYAHLLLDNENAIKVYEQIIKRFPNNPYLLYIYYNCYITASRMSDSVRQEKYRFLIENNYKDSQYAKMIKNSSYLFDIKNKMGDLDLMYSEAFNSFDNSNFSETIVLCDRALLKYPDSKIKDKFLLLKAYAVGKSYPLKDFEIALNNVLASNPSEDIAELTNGILAVLKKGGVPDYVSSSVVSEVSKKKEVKYVLDEDDEHYFILSMPKRASNMGALVYRMNIVCSNVISQHSFTVERSYLGLSNTLYIIKGIGNKDEGLKLLKAMIHDKKVGKILDGIDFRMFLVGRKNFNILKYREDMQNYLSFFVNSYFDNLAEAYSNIGVLSRGEMFFNKDFSSNHRFVLIFPFREFKAANIVAELNKYDADFQIELDDYDVKHQCVVVNNVGARFDAMKYFVGFSNYLKKNNEDLLLSSKLMIISRANYKIMYENKYDKEYLDYFKKNYKVDTLKDNNLLRSYGDFVYDEKKEHYFVLYYGNVVNGKRLEVLFRKYNADNLPVENRVFDDKNNVLIVSNIKDRKQAMMYYRAVLSNKKIYKIVKNKPFSDFVISIDNFNILLQNKNINEYLEFFKEWYLEK